MDFEIMQSPISSKGFIRGSQILVETQSIQSSYTVILNVQLWNLELSHLVGFFDAEQRHFLFICHAILLKFLRYHQLPLLSVNSRMTRVLIYLKTECTIFCSTSGINIEKSSTDVQVHYIKLAVSFQQTLAHKLLSEKFQSFMRI